MVWVDMAMGMVVWAWAIMGMAIIMGTILMEWAVDEEVFLMQINFIAWEVCIMVQKSFDIFQLFLFDNFGFWFC